ncbi:alpha/beta fold hydrolase [Paraburkholderia sp. SIMBA_030]|uniref:alpha/beta fold hydrolase n=1 Tax=Paraburkholderia sp. SIMBA_030 TaxID=3085773 RepID=UPI00397A426D
MLATTYRIEAPDLPGQGDSDRPMDGYDTHTLANQVHRFLQQLGIARYFLAAHDVGAWVAYPYASLFSDEVRRLALLDAALSGLKRPTVGICIEITGIRVPAKRADSLKTDLIR